MTSSASSINPATLTNFPVESLRRDFPILDMKVGGKPLVYLDNAATTQKPQVVIDALQRYYMMQNANVHRGVHYLSAQATDAFEQSRKIVAAFLGAADANQIIFVRGATEAINLVAHSFGPMRIREGDAILLTGMEHHANIVPWYQLAERTGARLEVVPVLDNGDLDLEFYTRALKGRVKLAAFTHVSNTLGTVNPVHEMIQLAKAEGIPVLLDGAQSAPHLPVHVGELDCDFFVCSGHKMYGPTGIGILYGKAEHLEAMPPFQGGGDMIRTVSFEKITYKRPPGRFEAGTPAIAEAIALGAGLEYLDKVGRESLAAYEEELLAYARGKLAEVEGVHLVGHPKHCAGAVSFLLRDAHPHDIGTLLDGDGIAIRAGHHCTQPLMKRFSVPATARASFAFYNNTAEVDMLCESLRRIRRLFH